MRAAAAALACVLAAAPAAAHQRSQSFSTWQVEGDEVRGVWTVLALEVTRLGPQTGSLDDLAGLLAAHLAATLSLRRGGEPCALASPPRPLRARPGDVRVEARYHCGRPGALELEDGAFFDAAPSHIHFARVTAPGQRPREVLFTDGARRQTLLAAPGEDAAAGAGFRRFVSLGIEHILMGTDHLAFLLSLILLGGGARALAGVVTGFTLGHSVTLSLATLGWVTVEPRLVDALIGFSIALVAAENLAVRGSMHVALGRGAALALAGAAALAASGLRRGGPPATTLAGLALFSACYLGLAASPDGTRRLRPAVTVLFGLVHGFSFASTLAELGLPRERLVPALFGFNAGVEIGQLAAVGVIVTLGLAAARLAGPRPRAIAADALSAALCSLGLLWFLGRAYG